MTPTDLYGAVLSIAEEMDLVGKWTRLSAELNFRGIKTTDGREWTAGNLRGFINRHVTQSHTPVTQHDVPHTVTQSHRPEAVLPANTEVLQGAEEHHRIHGLTNEPVTQRHTDVPQTDPRDSVTLSHTETSGAEDVTQPQHTVTQPELEDIVAHSTTETSQPEPVLQSHTPVPQPEEQDIVPHGLTPDGVTQERDVVTQDSLQDSVAQSHTAPEEPAPVTQSTTSRTPTLSDTAPQCSTTGSEDPDVTQRNTSVTQISPEMLAELGEMLAWWRDRRESGMTGFAVEERPAFDRRDTLTKTVRLDARMVRAAEKYAQKHRSLTGGTFSGLVELLVWQALGQPERFVTQESTESDSGTE